MNLLESVHRDYSTKPSWRLDEHVISAGFNTIDDTYDTREFVNKVDNIWKLDMTNFHDKHTSTYEDIVSTFAQLRQNSDKLILEIHTSNDHRRDSMLNVVRTLKHVYDFLVYERAGDTENSTVFVLCNENTLDHKELLIEEPNSSLMYHKLFRNKQLLRDLEGLGYTFQMGSGLKIYKKFYSSTHRGSGPSQRRTLQSIVIMKDGTFFRKIPKSKWVQLADPSDKDSLSWGELFMTKMIQDHQKKQALRKEKLMKKREERLSSNNP